jgi:hypothetical protein
MMETHYPHPRAFENKQGLHYNGFQRFCHRRIQVNQGLGNRDRIKFREMRGESAKSG